MFFIYFSQNGKKSEINYRGVRDWKIQSTFCGEKIIIPLNIVNNAKGKHSNKVKQFFKSKFQTPKT